MDKNEFEQISLEQKKRLDKFMDTYNKNIKSIGLRAGQDKIRFNIPYLEIGAMAGVSESAVTDFLKGKTVPHPVVVSAICGAIRYLKPQYVLKNVNSNIKKKK